MPNTSPYTGMLNNPLYYTDPDGNCPICIALIIGAVLGGGINVLSNAGNIGSLAEFGMYFGIGAAAGIVGAVAPEAVPVLLPFVESITLASAIGGGVSGFILGFGNTGMQGGNIGDMFASGGKGIVTGFLTAGATQGAQCIKRERFLVRKAYFT